MKLKIYKIETKLPKLLPINQDKGRYQECSKRVLIWCKWKNEYQDKPIMMQFGVLYKHNRWQVENIHGDLVIIAWTYIPLNSFEDAQ